MSSANDVSTQRHQQGLDAHEWAEKSGTDLLDSLLANGQSDQSG